MARKLRIQYPGAIYHVFGHVFSGRFKAPLVDGSGNGYLRRVGCVADADTISIGSGQC